MVSDVMYWKLEDGHFFTGWQFWDIFKFSVARELIFQLFTWNFSDFEPRDALLVGYLLFCIQYVVNVSVSVCFLGCSDKLLTKTISGRKEFIRFRASHHSPSLREAKTGTWRQELKQRPWRNAAYWLAPPGLPSLLLLIIQKHLPRCHTIAMVWALPHQ